MEGYFSKNRIEQRKGEGGGEMVGKSASAISRLVWMWDVFFNFFYFGFLVVKCCYDTYMSLELE